MFSSQRVVAKNSEAYKAWLAGLSRKQLKRQDLDVDLNLIIEAVSKLGLNFQAIGLCTLGIVRIHYGKVSVLLNDCQRASEMTRSINMLRNSKNVDPVIPNVEDIRTVIVALDQESCYIPSQPLACAIPANITIQENLPIVPFSVSNYEDFGNEGLLDFDVSLSQGIFDDRSVPQRDVKEEVEQNYNDMEFSDFEHFENSIRQEEVEIAKQETFVDQELALGGFEILAPSDIDAGINDHTPMLLDAEQKSESILDLSSLKSFSSGKQRNRRKRSFPFDEDTKISQTEMRKNVDSFSDLINRVGIVAPPTRKLMEMNEYDCFKLLTVCHIKGVRSKLSPVAEKYRQLCENVMNSSKRCSSQIPDDLKNVIGFSEIQRRVEDVVDPLPSETVNQNVNTVQKWLDEVDEAEVNNLHVEEPDFPVPEVQMEDHQYVDDVSTDPLKSNNSVRRTKRRRIDHEETDENFAKEEKNVTHSRFLDIMKELEQNGNSEDFTFNDVLHKIGMTDITRKVASRQFMTMLELVKLQEITVFQPSPLNPIVMKLSS